MRLKRILAHGTIVHLFCTSVRGNAHHLEQLSVGTDVGTNLAFLLSHLQSSPPPEDRHITVQRSMHMYTGTISKSLAIHLCTRIHSQGYCKHMYIHAVQTHTHTYQEVTRRWKVKYLCQLVSRHIQMSEMGKASQRRQIWIRMLSNEGWQWWRFLNYLHKLRQLWVTGKFVSRQVQPVKVRVSGKQAHIHQTMVLEGLHKRKEWIIISYCQ